MLARTNNKIAFVHLTSRVKQTVVAILSVVFGVSMYVFMNGFMSGVNEAQTILAFSTLSHIRVYNETPNNQTGNIVDTESNGTLVQVRNAKSIKRTSGIKNSSAIIEILDGVPEVKAVAPQVNLAASFRNGATEISGTLSGVDVAREDHVFGISQYMVEGRWKDLRYHPGGLIIGKTLAENLGVRVGDILQTVTPDGKNKSYTVEGIVELGITSVDGRKAFVNIASARQMQDENADYVTDIQVDISDYNKARNIAKELSSFIPFTVEPWQVASGQLEVGSELRNIIALAVSLTILIVAGFGIYNIMNMTVNEKLREIAIMNAMGFDGKDIVNIFLVQSVTIGLFGAVIGMAVGYGISGIVDNIPFYVANWTTYPMAYNISDYALALVAGLFTTFAAGYLPARKASKVDPVEILRG